MQKICAKKADYVIVLKGNQLALCQEKDLDFKALADEMATICMIDIEENLTELVETLHGSYHEDD